MYDLYDMSVMCRMCELRFSEPKQLLVLSASTRYSNIPAVSNPGARVHFTQYVMYVHLRNMRLFYVLWQFFFHEWSSRVSYGWC